MSTLGPSAAAGLEPQRPKYVEGLRALIDFAPKPGSSERLYAGVVSCLSTGEVGWQCAIDQRKAEHAFGGAGTGLYHLARALCESLAEHWSTSGAATNWSPPFESAKLYQVQPFSARDQESGHMQLLRRVSTLQTLLDVYQIEKQERRDSIVGKVRTAIRGDANASYLQRRFERRVHVGDIAGSLKVDFLGQHFACYFLQITRSAKGVEATAERAYSRLYELQALQRFVRQRPASIGLLEDERPSAFELVMVGLETDAVQRRAIHLVTALADRGEIRARPLPSPQAAAEHVFEMERKAA